MICLSNGTTSNNSASNHDIEMAGGAPATQPAINEHDRRDQPSCEAMALSLIDQGLKPIPLNPKGGNRSGKEPIGKSWGVVLHTRETIRQMYRTNRMAGVGLLLGSNPAPDDPSVERGVIDLEIDDPDLAANVLPRIFPDGIPPTLGFNSNRGSHHIFLYDPRLAKYGRSIIKGQMKENKKNGKMEVEGNKHYLGVEIRIGALPGEPNQIQSVIPPTAKDDGTPRQWIVDGMVVSDIDRVLDHILPLPECVYHDLDRYAIQAQPPARVREALPNGRGGAVAGLQWDAETVKRAIQPRFLDLAQRWGLRFTGTKFPTGFHECHAPERSDSDPSAGFHPESGVYHDFGPDESLSIFDLAVMLNIYGSVNEAINELGREFSVPPKIANAATTIDRTKLINSDRLVSDVSALLDAGEPEKIYSENSLLLAIAQLSDCNPGQFKLLRDKFREKSKVDDRFAIGDFDKVMKNLGKEAKKKNKELEAQKKRKANAKRKTTSAPSTIPAVPVDLMQPSGAGPGGESVEYTDAGIDKMAREHYKKKAETRQFSNWYMDEKEAEDGTIKATPRRVSVYTLDLVFEGIMNKWPKRVDNKLFIIDGQNKPNYITTSTKLFSLIDMEAVVDWKRGDDYITQERFFEHVLMTTERFDAIEVIPHFPKVEGIFYTHYSLPEPSGKLDQFVNYFCPATSHDRQLIKAMIVTLFWGGPPGKRPVFLITGPDNDPAKKKGRGLGKTTLMDTVVSTLAGGSMDLGQGASIEDFKSRLLSVKGAIKRVIRLDNIKSSKLSWGEFEKLITSEEISGWELYEGEGARPNLFTTIMTMNDPKLSLDVCERVIQIKLGRPQKVKGWEAEVRNFATKHRWEIIADIKDVLEREPAWDDVALRWEPWELGVLAKIEGGLECRRIVMERQGEIDADNEDKENVEQFFREKIKAEGYDPDENYLQLPSALAAAWLSEALRKHFETNKSTEFLKNLNIDELIYTRRTNYRGFIWLSRNFTGKDDDMKVLQMPCPPKIFPSHENRKYFSHGK